MKIYLAGKITGDENYREKFRKQEERLRMMGSYDLCEEE